MVETKDGVPGELDTALRGELREHEPLARHTSWRVGGPARRLYRPADADDLVAFLRRLDPAEPLLWLGLGSNLLVPDAGFPGTVIETQGCLGLIARRGPLGVYAQAGAACAKVARFAARHDLVGVEFLAGIPGTMGGALAMNAGAWGGETWAYVSRVRTVDRNGEVRSRTPADFRIGYREVRGAAGEWFLDVELRLQPGDGAAGMERIREPAGAAGTHPADRASELRVGLPQPARRSRGAVDRGGGSQRDADRRGRGLA